MAIQSKKFSILYFSDGIESYRHMHEIDEERREKAVSAFLNDIYDVITPAFNLNAAIFRETNIKQWKEDRAKIIAAWRPYVEDKNNNGYLDIAGNIIEGSLLLYDPNKKVHGYFPDAGSLVALQNAGAFILNGRLPADVLDPKWQIASETRTKKISRLPANVQKNPYQLAIAGQTLFRRFGDKTLTRKDLQDMASILSDYLPAYFVNAGASGPIYGMNITPTSELTDFKRDRMERALVDCDILAGVGAALLRNIRAFEISYREISGKKGAVGHVIAVAEYTDPSGERSALIVDNEIVSVVLLEKDESLEKKIEEHVAAQWSHNYDASEPVKITFHPGPVYDESLKKSDEIDASLAQYTVAFDVPLQQYHATFQFSLEAGKTITTTSAVHAGITYHTTLERINDGYVLYTVKPQGNGLSVFGLYDPYMRTAKYAIPTTIPLNRAEMKAVVLDLEKLKTHTSRFDSPISQILGNTRDEVLRVHLLDLFFNIMNEIGCELDLYSYFENPLAPEDEIAQQLRRLSTIPRHPLNDYLNLNGPIPATMSKNAKEAFLRVGNELAQKPGREAEVGAFLLGEYLTETKDTLSDSEIDGLLESLLSLYQSSENTYLCIYIVKLFLRLVEPRDRLQKKIEEKFSAALKNKNKLFQHVQTISDEILKEHERRAIAYLYTLASAFASDAATAEADAIFKQYPSISLMSLEWNAKNSLRGPAEAAQILSTYERAKRLRGILSEAESRALTQQVAQEVLKADPTNASAIFSGNTLLDLICEFEELSDPSETEQALLSLLQIPLYHQRPVTEEFYTTHIRPILKRGSTDKQSNKLADVFIRMSTKLTFTATAATLFTKDIVDFKIIDTCYTYLDILKHFLSGKFLSPQQTVAAFAHYLDSLYSSDIQQACKTQAMRSLPDADRTIADLLYREILNKPRKTHPSGKMPDGILTYAPGTYVAEPGDSTAILIASASAMCNDNESDHEEECKKMGRLLAARLLLSLEKVKTAKGPNDAGEANAQFPEFLRLLNHRDILLHEMRDEQVILASDLFEELLVHPNRSVRDQVLRNFDWFLQIAEKKGLQFPELAKQAMIVQARQKIPIGPVMTYRDLKTVLAEDPNHDRRKDAAGAIKYLVINQKTLQELHGKEAPPDDLVRDVKNLIAITQSDTSYPVVEAGERSQRLIESVVESYRTEPELVACEDEVETKSCYRSTYNTEREPGIVPVLLRENVDEAKAQETVKVIEAYYRRFPYQQHTHYFYAIEFLGKPSGKGEKAVKVIVDYPDIRDRSSANLTLQVASNAAYEDIIAHMAYPAFGQAPEHLRNNFINKGIFATWQATDEFYNLWKAWLSDSQGVWEKVYSEFQKNTPDWDSPLAQLLIMIQIMSSEAEEIITFSAFEKNGSWKIEYDLARKGKIRSITMGEKKYQFSYNNSGMLIKVMTSAS